MAETLLCNASLQSECGGKMKKTINYGEKPAINLIVASIACKLCSSTRGKT